MIEESGSSGFTTPQQVKPAKTTKSKLVVLHLVTSLEVGGAQHGMLLGLPRFSGDQYEHIVCSIMDRVPMASQFRAAGIEVRSLGLRRKSDLGVALRLRKLLNEIRPDILHTYLLHANILGRLVGRLVGVPVIIGSERTIGQARRWGRLATRLTNSLADAVEVNSETGGLAIQEDLGVPASKIEVIHSGLDFQAHSVAVNRDQLRTELNVTSDECLILYMGRLRRVKGVEFGIKAFASALRNAPGIRLAIAGEGDQRENLESLVHELGIDERVRFLGVRSDVPEILGAADIVLLPSLTEGFPRAAIESMAAGRPVVATNVGGTPEAVTDGETGLLVPSQDVKAMSSAIVKLVTDRDLRASLGKAGQDRARERYAVETYVSSLDEMYRRLSSTSTSQR